MEEDQISRSEQGRTGGALTSPFQYKKWIGPIAERKNNQAYEEAAALIKKIRLLMSRLSRDADFADYLRGVRAAHKPKRNFMKLLDRIM